MPPIETMGQFAREPGSVIDKSGNRLARRVLLIGWDGADSKLVQSLLQSGRLSHLQSLVERGARLELAVPRPAHAPSAWTSLATGTRPHEHGALHSLTPTADGLSLEPIGRRSRRRPAIWNLLNAAGLQTHVIGWPATSPVEPLAGVCVSDQISAAINSGFRGNFSSSLISPVDLLPVLRSRIVAPPQIDEITVAQLLPRSAAGLTVLPQLTLACRSILAEAASLFRILRWCLGERPWDFAACVFPGLRRAHELAQWLVSVAPEAAECARDLVVGCYEHHDLLLGQLLQQIGETHVAAVALGASSAGGESTTGIAALAGPAVRPAQGPTRRSSLDFTPTVLAMLGAPRTADLHGRPWADLFECDLAAQTQAGHSLDSADANCETTESVVSSGAEDAVGVLSPEVEHLAQLGYVDPRAAAARESVRNCRWMTQFQCAVSQLDAGLLDGAIISLEKLVEQQRESHLARATLADALFRANRRQHARQQIEWLRFHGNEQPQVYRLAAAIELADRNFDKSLVELQGTRRGAARCAGADSLEGDVWLRKRQFESARDAYHAAVEREGPTRAALSGLADVELHQGNSEAAAMNALDALAVDMHNGRAHFCLAVALSNLGKAQEAIQALELWAKVEPAAAAPYRWMARVYEQQIADPGRAAECRLQGREIVRQRRSLKSSPVAGTSTLSSRQ